MKRRKFLKMAVALPALSIIQVPTLKTNLQQEEKETVEIEKWLEIVKLRYGKFLGDEQIEFVKDDLRTVLQRRVRLLEFKLSNWDEPDFTFHV